MHKHEFTTAAKSALGRFGQSAHEAIELYREGGDRIAALAGQRWDRAFAQAKPQLSPETRKNAANAKRVAGRYWTRGVAMSADGAKVAVDTFVGATIAGIERVAAYKPA